jgi:hypothetical protein
LGRPHEQSTNKEELDTAITTIWGNLESICHTSFLQKVKYIPWWTPKLNTLRKWINTLKRRVKRTKNQALRESHNRRYKDLKPIQSGNPRGKARLMEGFLHRACKQLSVENIEDV